jgi:hypothetical protein
MKGLPLVSKTRRPNCSSLALGTTDLRRGDSADIDGVAAQQNPCLAICDRRLGARSSGHCAIEQSQRSLMTPGFHPAKLNPCYPVVKVSPSMSAPSYDLLTNLRRCLISKGDSKKTNALQTMNSFGVGAEAMS